MFTAEDFTTALASAREQLQLVAQALREVQCPPIVPVSVNLCELTVERIEELLDPVPSGYRKEDKGSDYVYVLRVASQQNGLPRRLPTSLRRHGNWRTTIAA